jgi:hypothetical protein
MTTVTVTQSRTHKWLLLVVLIGFVAYVTIYGGIEVMPRIVTRVVKSELLGLPAREPLLELPAGGPDQTTAIVGSDVLRYALQRAPARDRRSMQTMVATLAHEFEEDQVSSTDIEDFVGYAWMEQKQIAMKPEHRRALKTFKNDRRRMELFRYAMARLHDL